MKYKTKSAYIDSGMTNIHKVRGAYTDKTYHNTGGIREGLGYVAGNIGIGAAGIVEGATDLVSAAGYALTGQGDKAKAQFLDSWSGEWKRQLDDWYNPNDTMSFFGDVGSALGNSLVAVIPYVGLPAFFAGASGGGISSAAEKTGDVGFKEVGYGVTSGIVESLLEKYVGPGAAKVQGIGTKAVNSVLKNTTKSAVRNSVWRQVFSNMGEEFLEESLSEMIDPMIQRLYQVDPNAATSFSDVLRAGFVGAISGSIMGGAQVGGTAVYDSSVGRTIAANGNSATLKRTAEGVLSSPFFTDQNGIQDEGILELAGTLNSYNALTPEKLQSGEGYRLLGAMKRQLFGIEARTKSAPYRREVVARAEDTAAYASRFFGKAYTAEDIKADKDGVLTQLTVLRWAGDAETQARVKANMEAARAAAMEAGGVADNVSFEVAQEMEAQENASENTAENTAETVENPDLNAEANSQAVENLPVGRERTEAAAAKIPTPEEIQSMSDEQLMERIGSVEEFEAAVREYRRAFNSEYESLSEGDPRKKELRISRDAVSASIRQVIERAKSRLGSLANEQTQEQKKPDEPKKKRVDRHTPPKRLSAARADKKAAQAEYDAVKGLSNSPENVKKKAEAKKLLDAANAELAAAEKANAEYLEKRSERFDLEEDVEGDGEEIDVEDLDVSGETAEAEESEEESEKETEPGEKNEDANEVEDNTEDADRQRDEIREEQGGEESTEDTDEDGEAEPDPIEKRQLDERTKRMLGAYDSSVVEKARKLLRDFDLLSFDRKVAVCELIESSPNMGKNELRAMCVLVAQRDGLFAYSSPTKHKGIYKVLGGMKDRRLVVLSDKDSVISGEGKGNVVGETIFHEIAHDIFAVNKRAFKMLADVAMRYVSPEQRREIQDRYTKHYTGVRFSDWLAEEANKGKTLDDFVQEKCPKGMEPGKFMELLTEEVVTGYIGKAFADTRYIKYLGDTRPSTFKRIARTFNTLFRCLFGKNKLAEQALAEVYATFSRALKDTQVAEVWNKTTAVYERYDEESGMVLPSEGVERYNLAAVDSHKQALKENYTASASIPLETLMERYDAIVDLWNELGGELDSDFLRQWNEKKKDKAFTVFKAQAGYKYNIELSSMCKKGVPLFEAIDTIVRKEALARLGNPVLDKRAKELLYDILKEKGFEIPCAICYVEQARQREGVIIRDFLDGIKGRDKYKIGWNSLIGQIEAEMAKNGVEYRFPKLSRDISGDGYSPELQIMTKEEQTAYFDAVKKLLNREIKRYNEESKKNRPTMKAVTAEEIKRCLGGTLPSNLKIFKVLLTEPSSRFTIDGDLLYSSVTTHNLAAYHTQLYSLFNSQGGVSGYKTKQQPIAYWGELLGKKWKLSTVRESGGIRNQSNSDGQMYTLLDLAQMYIDATAKGFYIQAYTKVLAELRLFGLSRAKINASLIPRVRTVYNADGTVNVEATRENAGLDANGEPIYDDFEGIPHEEAFDIIEDAEYSKSVGGVCIGYSDNHILKLLDDGRIQLIIGYHDKTNDPRKRYRGARYAKNYNGLNEAVNAKGETVHIGFNQFVIKAEKMFKKSKNGEFSGVAELNGKSYEPNDIPRLAADLYLEHCREKGYRPAYSGIDGGADFSKHRNYYKLLADFSLYDSTGAYAPHQKVEFKLPDSVPVRGEDGVADTMKSKEYIKKELQKELSVRDGIAAALADDSAYGVIPRFEQGMKELAGEDYERLSLEDEEYLDAVKRGDTETAQRMVDEAAKAAGYDTKAYHGTRNEFYVFDSERIGDNYGGYNAAGGAFDFSTNEDRARLWGAKASGSNAVRVIPVYLKANKTFYSYHGKVPGELESVLPKQASASEKIEAMSSGRVFAQVLEKYGVDFKTAITSKGYDSYAMYPGSENISVYNSSQIKSADPVTYDDNGNVIPLSKRFDSAEDDIRYSLEDEVTEYGSGKYTYDSLIKKEPLVFTEVPDDIPRESNGRMLRRKIIELTREDVRSQNNPNNTSTDSYVYIPDIGLNVRVNRDGIEHGLGRADDNTAIVTLKLGSILRNAIAINETDGRTTSKKQTDMSYVLVSVAKNKNDSYAVRIVVDKNTNAVAGISAYGLYSVKAKEKGELFLPDGNEGVEDNSSVPYLLSTISIADFFEKVKGLATFNEIFSKDVAKRLGVTRSVGDITGLRYNLDGENDGGKGEGKKLSDTKQAYAELEDRGINKLVASNLANKVVFRRPVFEKYATIKERWAALRKLLKIFGLTADIYTSTTQVDDDAKGYGKRHSGRSKMLEDERETAIKELVELMPVKYHDPDLWQRILEARRFMWEKSIHIDEELMEKLVKAAGCKSPAQFYSRNHRFNYARGVWTDNTISVGEAYERLRAAYPDIIKETDSEFERLWAMYRLYKVKEVDVAQEYSSEEISRMKAEFESDIRSAMALIHGTAEVSIDKAEEDARIAGYKLSIMQTVNKLRVLLKDKRTGAEEADAVVKALITRITKPNAYASKAGDRSWVDLDEEKLAQNLSEMESIINGFLAELDKSELLRAEGDAVTERAVVFGQYVSKEVIDSIRETATRVTATKGERMSADEFQLIEQMLAGVLQWYRDYDMAFVDGRWQQMGDVLSGYLTDSYGIVNAQREKNKKDTGKFKGLKEICKALKNSAAVGLLDTHAVFAMMDGYRKNGLFTRLWEQLESAMADQAILREQILTERDEFLSKHKDFEESLRTRKIKFEMSEITLGEAITLHLTAKRNQAFLALYGSDITVLSQPTVHFKGNGFEGGANDTQMQEAVTQRLQQITEALRGDSVAQEYIKIVEKFFNESSKEIKREADERYYGYTNVEDGYYIPISRDKSAFSPDMLSAGGQMDSFISVTSLPFNKHTIKNAKAALVIGNINDLVNRHADGLSKYATMHQPINAVNRLLGRQITAHSEVKGDRTIWMMEKANSGSPESLMKLFCDAFFDGDSARCKKYFTDLLNSAQGFSQKQYNAAQKLVDYIVKNATVNALGLNIKSVMSQLAAIPLAGYSVSHANLLKGLSTLAGKVKELKAEGEMMDRYSRQAHSRNVDFAGVRAGALWERHVPGMGKVLDKISKVSEATMAPIGATDRLTFIIVWEAAQHQAERAGYAIGTEENRKMAGKIVDEFAIMTQPTVSAANSAAARTDNLLAKTFMRFTSANNKMFSRMVEGIARYTTLKTAKKNKLADISEREIKEAEGQARRMGIAVVSAQIMLVGLIQLFKFAFAKDRDEDETVVEDILGDTVDSFVGLVPVLSQVHGFFADGYEISDLSFDTINEAMQAMQDTGKIAASVFTGEAVQSTEVARALRNALYTTGSMFGIPVRNTWNNLTGLIKRASPSAGANINAIFYDPSASDLTAALNGGNERLAETIAELMLSRRGGELDYTAAQEFLALYSVTDEDGAVNAYNIMPKKSGDQVTVDGKSYVLDAKQYKRFKQTYSGVSVAIADLVARADYKALPEAERAKAIKTMYALYYDKAATAALGTAPQKSEVISDFVSDLSGYVAAMAYASGISGDGRKDKILEYLNRSDLSASDQTWVLASLGYKTEKDKAIGMVERSSLTATQKANAYKRLGVKNE